MSRCIRAAIAAAVLVAAPLALSAQQEETLTGNAPLESGGFGAPVFKLTQIHGGLAGMSGGRGGWIINHRFVVGGAGYGLQPGIHTGYTSSGLRPDLQMGYGGLDLGYVDRSNRIVHMSGDVLVGAGAVSYQDHMDGAPSSQFTVVEPAVDLELNVSRWFRIAAGGSYRFISGVSIPDVSASDLRGVAGTLAFKFGKF